MSLQEECINSMGMVLGKSESSHIYWVNIKEKFSDLAVINENSITILSLLPCKHSDYGVNLERSEVWYSKGYYKIINYKRVQEYRLHLTKGFTQKYNVHKLVYYEIHYNIKDAIVREKQLKKWNRLWKLRLIENMNPQWEDLGPGFPPPRE